MRRFRESAFRKGDSVKLKDRYADALCQSPKNRVNWRDRVGTVARCGALYVGVRWPGRTSVDQIPIQGVEKA